MFAGGEVFVGVAHAPIYPFRRLWWNAGSRWALGTAQCGGQYRFDIRRCAGAATGRVVMVYWGWRASFYVFIPLGIALFWLWWRYATDDPADHPAMTDAELPTFRRTGKS
ncbi:MAG: hypothetical protein CM15mP103_06850 [Gammaproteobacteria bacterium]|nr:MAG: hypothetical protein CM15mP103_06850 [Gammaproteobacteria bacterium]